MKTDTTTQPPEAPDSERVGDCSATTCSACRYVYVVATGGYRFPVESEIPLTLWSAFKAALPRFEEAGHMLGQLVEITECSDDADPSDPYYIETTSALKKLGKFHEPNDQALASEGLPAAPCSRLPEPPKDDV